jgi:surface polysaccharide O-acyltransferase-like enzyme
VGQGRIYYLDWLKVLIVYGILLFHSSLVFTTSTWLVSNHDRSQVLTAFAGFCFPWGIPAMFLIAGADAYFGIRSRGAGEFVWARVLRLLLPMLVGLVVLSPYQRFVTSHNPPPPLSALPAFYVHFFTTIRFEPDPEWISKYWLHLWFLAYLFVISVACLPLLRWLHRPGGVRFTEDLIRLANIRGGLFLMAAPLFLTQLVLRPFFPAYQDWADIATYTFVFAMGAIFFSNQRFEAAIRRDVRAVLIVGALAALGLAAVLSLINFNMGAIGRLTFPEQVALSLFWTLDVWMWNLAVLYIGIRWLTRPSRALEYTSQSVLAFYVIHHPVIVTLASFIVTWDLGLWPKFAILVILGYAITLTIYEVGVRRWPPMRTLFGLGPRPRPQSALSHA